LTVFSPFLLFDQWYFTSLRRSRNEKITEIREGSLSWRLFTRLFPTRSLCSSPLECDSKASLLAGYGDGGSVIPKKIFLKRCGNFQRGGVLKKYFLEIQTVGNFGGEK